MKKHGLKGSSLAKRIIITGASFGHRPRQSRNPPPPRRQLSSRPITDRLKTAKEVRKCSRRTVLLHVETITTPAEPTSRVAGGTDFAGWTSWINNAGSALTGHFQEAQCRALRTIIVGQLLFFGPVRTDPACVRSSSPSNEPAIGFGHSDRRRRAIPSRSEYSATVRADGFAKVAGGYVQRRRRIQRRHPGLTEKFVRSEPAGNQSPAFIHAARPIGR